MVKADEIELGQLKAALAYLSGRWESHPGSSEDPETCRQHAKTLRSLLVQVELLEPGAPDRLIQAAVHKARLEALEE